MVVSPYPQFFQGEFITLVGLLSRVGLRTNIGKIVGMVCRPCQAAGTQLEAAYGQWMTGEGHSYREQQKGRVQCREFREDMAAGYLAGHRMTHNGQAAEERRRWKTSATGEEPQTYCMDFPAKGGPQSFPLEGCPGREATRSTMRVHFLHWRVLDTVVVLEERNLPHPRCPRCDMMVPWRTLNIIHPATAQCASGAERKMRRLAEE